MNGSDMFSQQQTTAGGIAGPRLDATLFIRKGFGFAFQDDAGAWWQLRLAENEDGTTWYGSDGKPTIELIQVAI